MALYKNLLIGMGFLAMVLFVIRPLLKSLRLIKPPVFETFEPINEMSDKLSSSDKAQIAMQMAEQQTLVETAKKDPYQVAQILQNWLSEENK
jgi:flagellar M-ring protein FliF